MGVYTVIRTEIYPYRFFHDIGIMVLFTHLLSMHVYLRLITAVYQSFQQQYTLLITSRIIL